MTDLIIGVYERDESGLIVHIHYQHPTIRPDGITPLIYKQSEDFKIISAELRGIKPDALYVFGYFDQTFNTISHDFETKEMRDDWIKRLKSCADDSVLIVGGNLDRVAWKIADFRVDFSPKITDTHNCLSGTVVFTAPRDGLFVFDNRGLITEKMMKRGDIHEFNARERIIIYAKEE